MVSGPLTKSPLTIHEKSPISHTTNNSEWHDMCLVLFFWEIVIKHNLWIFWSLVLSICNIAKTLHSPSCIKQNKHWLSCYLYRRLDFPTLGWRSLPQRHTAPQLDKRGVEVERLRGCRQVQSRHVLPPTKGFAFCTKVSPKKKIIYQEKCKGFALVNIPTKPVIQYSIIYTAPWS